MAERATYPGTIAEWLQTRFRAAVRALVAYGVPFDRALTVARVYLAMWALETGWGRSEVNFNLGFVRTGSAGTPDTGEFFRRDDAGQTAAFRSYRDLDAAAADAVRFLATGRYAPAFAHLLRNPTDARGWYDRLLRAGYHPWHAADLDALESALRMIPARAA